MRNAYLERVANRVLGKKGTSYGIEAKFLTPSGVARGYSVVELTTAKDFVGKFTSDITIQVMVAMLDYRYKLFQHRDNLKVIVSFMPLDAGSNIYLSSVPVIERTYRALLLDNDDLSNAPGSKLTSKKESTAKDENVLVRLQLVEPYSEAMAYKQAQGTFRYTDNENILRGYLAEMIRREKEVNTDIADMRLEVAELSEVIDNRDAITIPADVKLTAVPKFLQEREGGLYSHGLGSFIDWDTWWIYPVFDTSRFVKTTDRLKIIQLADYSAPVTDNTWEYIDGELTIVCTTASKMQDLSVSNQVNDGTGTRFIKASEMFQNSAQGDPNKEHLNTESIMAEFQVGQREDGNNVARYSSSMITDNIANEYSKIAWRQGQIFITIWQRSMIQMITPGMPVRVYMDKDGTLLQYDGIVINVQEQWASEKEGMIDKNMISSAAVTCFLNKEPNGGRV